MTTRRVPVLVALAVLAAAALWWTRPGRVAPMERASLRRSARVPAAVPTVGRERPGQARAADEWQGMRIDVAAAPPCESSAGCGLGRACKRGRCTACTADRDCAAGEACALDHCVVQALAACRGRADCPSGQLCLLSGYSSLARGNEGMRAYCLDPASGAGAMPPAPAVDPDPRTRLPDDELLDRARSAARGRPAPL